MPVSLSSGAAGFQKKLYIRNKKNDSDGSVHTHDFMPRYLQDAHAAGTRWAPAPPRTVHPPCPECGASTRGATGAAGGAAAYAYAPHAPEAARLSYTCDKCDRKCSCKNPATLARSDPSAPRITEDPDVTKTKTHEMKPAPAPRPQGTRQSPRLAINPPAVPAPYRVAGTSIPKVMGGDYHN